jgi:hypothetical protein
MVQILGSIIEVQVEDNAFLEIMLRPAYSILDEVIIEGNKNSRQWHSNLMTFRKYFIGMSDNAERCRIKNEKALSFKERSGLLTAKSDSALIIENLGLGYNLTFLLQSFMFNSIGDKVMYRGQVVFSPIKPKDDNQGRQWASNRLKAYEGSQMHFMRALYRRRLMEEGFFFNVFENKYIDTVLTNSAVADSDLRVKSKLFKEKIKMRSSINYYRVLDSAKSTFNRPVLGFSGQLEVTYIHEAESYKYLRAHYPQKVGFTRPQKSRLVLLKQDLPIESNGMILHEEHLSSQGYWSWELVSESLPVDYDPESDRKILNDKRRRN